MIQLGRTVRDTLTGFEGVVVCVAHWLNGCTRVSVQSRELREGKPVDFQTFDIEQLQLVDAKGFQPPLPVPAASGGPRPDPMRPSTPR